ncbi:MAG: 5-formyltetrahydrofolate cyclo-ligase [Pseudobutyrivibrio ruminis]|uniref:5-formyltetrahydrofolate cyclo-ligase n=1 Tax=Pseudobutyrivibrio ruminis TaxID=46206 RepID=A0A927YLQ9_9FIRM|nr:5-formyltetrahydrofolate cyclo-ligase [Pseudobutyrivibrio ruminis]
MEVNQSKDLRNIHKKLRNDMSDMEHKIKSADIVKNTLALLESDFKGANIFLCYYPFGSEVDLLPLYENLLNKGKTLYFPVSDVKNHKLHFYKISHLRSDFVKGAYDIMEPRCDLGIFDYQNIILNQSNKIICITPGLVFDRAFNRIGYGAGFYDRFLEDKNLVKIAMCFSNQLRTSIPTCEHDVKMNIIVTEDEVLKGDRL